MVIEVADIPAILVIAGIIFIFIAIVGEIGGQFKTKVSELRAKILFILGVINLSLGIITGALGTFTTFHGPVSNPTVSSPQTDTSLVTPTSSPTPSSTSQSLTINIIKPKNGDNVPYEVWVNGTFNGILPEGQYLWLMMDPFTNVLSPPDSIWPSGEINESYWSVPVYLGDKNNKTEIGRKYNISIVLVNETEHKYYVDYRKIAETINHTGVSRSTILAFVTNITVTRVE